MPRSRQARPPRRPAGACRARCWRASGRPAACRAAAAAIISRRRPRRPVPGPPGSPPCPALSSRAARLADRGVLERRDHQMAASAGASRQLEDHGVVGLGPRGGEDHLRRPGAEQRRHLLPRLLDRVRAPPVRSGGSTTGLPCRSPSQGSIASRARGWSGVVALWSRYTVVHTNGLLYALAARRPAWCSKALGMMPLSSQHRSSASLIRDAVLLVLRFARVLFAVRPPPPARCGRDKASRAQRKELKRKEQKAAIASCRPSTSSGSPRSSCS